MSKRKTISISAIRKAIRIMDAQPKHKTFVGIVHPLQALWIKWRVHPLLFDEHSESQNMRDQLEAEWRQL